MTGNDFRAALPGRVRAALPEEWQEFQHRARYGFVQFWYGEPTLHFEVWPQAPRGVVEVGLHLEHRDAAVNRALHLFFDHHFVEIRHELGDCWLERWDRGWHKLYTTLPFPRYSEPLCDQASHLLAQQIIILQPLLTEGLRTLPLNHATGL